MGPVVTSILRTAELYDFARTSFSALLFAILLLVTGCGSSADYSPRTDLAPPPPFLVASSAGQEMHGPAVPTEIAMMNTIDMIEPAAGIEEPFGPYTARTGCRIGLTESRHAVSFGGHERLDHEGELSFARMHSGRDSAGMTVRLSFSLPVAVKKGCR